jgi:NAD-reducing hydrogenase small subunit
VATTSLAGCFGCHMSLLDIDERLFDADRACRVRPLAADRHQGRGPLRPGPDRRRLCNAENIEVLQAFRAQCKVLVAVGACAINGGLPAQRNRLDIGDVLREVYVHRPGTREDAQVPNDPELPLPLNQVRPIHEVVLIDYELPGCRPRPTPSGPSSPICWPGARRAWPTARSTTTDAMAAPDLETAAHPEGLRRVAIDPVSRVEGHGKVTLLLDEHNRVQQARLHIVEFRGFEAFIRAAPTGKCR